MTRIVSWADASTDISFNLGTDSTLPSCIVNLHVLLLYLSLSFPSLDEPKACGFVCDECWYLKMIWRVQSHCWQTDLHDVLTLNARVQPTGQQYKLLSLECSIMQSRFVRSKLCFTPQNHEQLVNNQTNNKCWSYRLYKSISISYSFAESDSRKINLNTGIMMSEGIALAFDGSAT